MKRNITLVTVTTLALFLNACGGGGSSPKSTIQGKFIDSPVYGAQYRCGKLDNKITQQDGSFVCETLPVTFYVGGVKLGEVHTLAADGYVTPHDLVGVARNTYGQKVNNIALFLQSLDDDGNIDTAITIEKKHIEKLKNKQYDIHTMTHDQVVDLLGELDVVNIVSPEKAHEHLRAHIEAIPTHNPAQHDPNEHNPTDHTPVTPDPSGHNPTDHTPVTPDPSGHNPTDHTPVTPDPSGHNPTDHTPVSHDPSGHNPTDHTPVSHDPNDHNPTNHNPLNNRI